MNGNKVKIFFSKLYHFIMIFSQPLPRVRMSVLLCLERVCVPVPPIGTICTSREKSYVPDS